MISVYDYSLSHIGSSIRRFWLVYLIGILLSTILWLAICPICPLVQLSSGQCMGGQLMFTSPGYCVPQLCRPSVLW